jgi:hypothetical protein
MRLQTTLLLLFLTSAFFIMPACSNETSDDENKTTANYIYYQPESGSSASGEGPPSDIDSCFLTRNASSILRVEALEDISAHPATCDPIPYSMSHYTLPVKIKENLAGIEQPIENMEIVFVNIPFMVAPIQKGDELLINVRFSRGIAFGQTHLLLMEENTIVEDVNRSSNFNYTIDLPPYQNISTTIGPLFEDQNYTTLCKDNRVTVDDSTFESLKFERREECSENTDDSSTTPEPNPVVDEPG